MGVHITEPVTLTFIHMKKNGGTSVQEWLLNNCKGYRFNKHGSYKWIIDHIKNPGIIFTVVRNPFARLWSMYNYQLIRTKRRIFIGQNTEQSKSIANLPKFKKKYNLQENTKVLEKLEKGFKHYVLNQTWMEHQWPQAINCDHTLKIEKINKDFRTIQKLTGIDIPLHQSNATNHGKNYKEHYDKEMIEHVYKQYESDFKNLNYQF